MKNKEVKTKEKKQAIIQAIKYFCCAASAGVIQIASFTLLQLFIKSDKTMWFMIEMPVGDFISTTIALILSIVWNFTLNRKFTFKDAGNVPKAMTLAFLFYVPFYPFQTWYVPTIKALLIGQMGTDLALLAAIIAEGTVMILNGVLEFCWQKFIVFRKTEKSIANEKALIKKYNNEVFSRTINLIGQENFEKLQKSNILLIGVGGVGSYVAEGLIRAGVGNMTIIDSDVVSKSNINRQIIALNNTVKRSKVKVAERRLLNINKYAKIETKKEYISPKNAADIDFSKYNFVIDAIDYVPGKTAIIKEAKNKKINVISCMGTGNKLHPEMFKIDDISKTSVCPLAKVMRKELSKMNITNVPVLYSTEEPSKNLSTDGNKRVPSSISTVPSIAGLLIANYVINEIIK